MTRQSPAGNPLVDDRLLRTAHQMATIADTNDEQDLAGETPRLADHELDQAFASAIRETAAAATPATGPLKQLTDRIAQIKARMAADQTRIDRLAKAASANDATGDQLELAIRPSHRSPRDLHEQFCTRRTLLQFLDSRSIPLGPAPGHAAAAGNPHLIAQQIREKVEQETEAGTGAAEQDWERVTRQYGVRPFSAKPAVDLRPSVNGLDVIVRYITRAPQRSEMKSRLFEVIVDLLHKPAATTQADAEPTKSAS